MRLYILLLLSICASQNCLSMDEKPADGAGGFDLSFLDDPSFLKDTEELTILEVDPSIGLDLEPSEEEPGELNPELSAISTAFRGSCSVRPGSIAPIPQEESNTAQDEIKAWGAPVSRDEEEIRAQQESAYAFSYTYEEDSDNDSKEQIAKRKIVVPKKRK